MTVHKPEKNSSQSDKRCGLCGKPNVQPSHIGTITSYLFQAGFCSCQKDQNLTDRSAKTVESTDADVDFCPRCGFIRKTDSRPGTLTAYLFEATTCRCAEDEKFDSACMSQRFWKLKQEGHPSFKDNNAVPGIASAGPAHVDLAEGTVIAGVYQIIKQIGAGGMGEVYLTEHLTLGRQCAVKVMPPAQVTAVGWQRFQNEARTFAKLAHINLVRVSDLGIHDGYLPFYAMDYVEGQTLSDLLAKQGPLPVERAAEIFMQVCDGVEYAHRNGIIHRDLKPANIMIAREDKSNPEKVTVKILDFGLAKLTQHDRKQQSLTAAGEMFGSPCYMSPEQCNSEKLDNRSDIYSVGCTLFESLTGRPPFYGNMAVAILSSHIFGQPPTLESLSGPGKFPDAMEIVVAKLLRKNPAERYQTMGELKGDLEKVARGESVDPVYVSRTKSSPVMQDPAQAQLAGDGATVHVPSKLMLGCAFAAALLAVGLGVFLIGKSGSSRAVPSYRQPVSIQSNFEAPIKVAAAVKTAIWDGKPFFKGIKNHSGKLVKTWQFPQSAGINLGYLQTGGPEGQSQIPLRSTVTVPASNRVGLVPAPAITNWPDMLKGFTDGNIDGLNLSGFALSEFGQVAAGLAQLKSIDSLYIDGVEGDDLSAAKCVEVANYYPNLNGLVIKTLSDGHPLSLLHRLKKLKQLALLRIGRNSGDVFAALRGSTELNVFSIGECPVTASVVRELATCSNLQVICFRSQANEFKEVEAEDVAPLTKLKRLRELELCRVPYSPGLVAVLAKCTSLKILLCDSNTKWTDEQEEELKKILPNTIVNFTLRGKASEAVNKKPI
jgi:serine/threonine protein kinase